MIDERAFYQESPATRPAQVSCPYCRTTQTCDLRWLIRRKKDRIPPQADERDRARYAKAQCYMVLHDDRTRCKSPGCGKTFDRAGIKTTEFRPEG